jgi:integrase
MSTTPVRAKGTGSQRPDGLWRVRVTVAGKRRDFYGPSLHAAQAKARKETQTKRQRPAGALTVAEWLTTWIEDRRASLKPQTWTRYHRLVHDQLVPAFGNVRLAEVGPQDVKRLHAQLRASRPGRAPLSGTTQHHAHVVLGTALQAAVNQGLLAANPTRVVMGPRMTVRERTILSREESSRLLESSKDDPYHALYVLALTTGMRLGELLALTWRDVDLDTGVLTVNGSVGLTTAGTLVLQTPKTVSARRQITLPRIAVEALRVRPQDGVYVFPNADGGLMSARNLSRRNFRPLADRAGLPASVTVHGLRHTCATHLLEDGIPAHVVSRMLGHASVAITLSLYAHVTPGMQDAARAAMDTRYSAA